MMFLVINSDNKIIASSANAINEEDCATRNETVVEIPDDDYSDKMIGATHKGDSSYSLPQLPLKEARAKAIQVIDSRAGQMRQKFITITPGQSLTYQEKAEEAADYVAAGYPDDLSNYPFIQLEVEVTGKKNEKAAEDILKQKSSWIAANVKIERHRMSGKLKVQKSRSLKKIDEIVEETLTLLDKV